MIRIAIFFGGKSVEHEVSIISGLQALNAFKGDYDLTPVYVARSGDMYVGPAVGRVESYRDAQALVAASRRVICVADGGRYFLEGYPPKRWGRRARLEFDLAFPIMHGTNVEDGALQGFFKTLGIPFVGPDVTASAVGMDKYFMKTVLKDAGLPVLAACKVRAREFFRHTAGTVAAIEAATRYPVIVKPLNLGSSVGIKKAADGAQLAEALEYALQYADTAIAENAVANLREINCAALGDGDGAEASECEEPVGTDLILSYDDKYGAGAKGMSGAKRKLPAPLAPGERENIRSLAVRAFLALGCDGVARVDFLMDGATGQVWVNELNTIPGSLSFYLWEPLGLTYAQLLDRLVALALKRQREAAGLTYSFETNILSNFSGGLKGAKGGK